jgi:uncharacterized membrane protein
VQSLNDLREKIHTLETEKSQLKDEIENLRKAAETKAASLKEDIDQLREEAKSLRELLTQDNPEPVRPVSQAVPEVKPLQSPPEPQATSVTQPALETPIESSISTQIDSNDQQDLYQALLKTLTGDERKVVEVLLAHGGKYSQKHIRTEADLSWLQTNRVVSRLAERGIITLEKDGTLGNVVLTNQIK